MSTAIPARHLTWNVQVAIDETDDETRAKATVEVDGHPVTGWGRARRNPADPRVPRIGEELAVARALGELSHRLLDAAVVEIEQFSSRDVRVHP
ncbi:MAG TPA: DUF1876 domain-containing protein [Acidimicrobiales bacterium]